MNYCSVCNNTARFCIIINQETDNAVMNIEMTNIIENKQNKETYGLINVDGPTTIVHCTLLNNDPLHRWFYASRDGGVEAGVITLIDCTIEDNFTLHTSGDVTYDDITPSESFINALRHTENEHCAAAYDFVGSLTPDFGFPNNLCSKRPAHLDGEENDADIDFGLNKEVLVLCMFDSVDE